MKLGYTRSDPQKTKPRNNQSRFHYLCYQVNKNYCFFSSFFLSFFLSFFFLIFLVASGGLFAMSTSKIVCIFGCTLLEKWIWKSLKGGRFGSRFLHQLSECIIMHAPSGDRSTEIERVLLSDHYSTSKPPRLDENVNVRYRSDFEK